MSGEHMEGGNQKILAPTRTEQGILYVRRADGRGELKDRSTHENRTEQNKASYTHEIRTSILYVRRTEGRGNKGILVPTTRTEQGILYVRRTDGRWNQGILVLTTITEQAFYMAGEQTGGGTKRS
jgi:hypothetical protein